MKNRKVMNMSQKEITDNYSKIVGNRNSSTSNFQSTEKHFEFGYFQRATILKDSAISYSSSTFEKRIS